MQHDDCDHDHHPFDAFLLIAFTSAPWLALAAPGRGADLESEPGDLYPMLWLTDGYPPLPTMDELREVCDHVITMPLLRPSAATLDYRRLIDELNHRMAPGLPASAFDEASSGSFSMSAAGAAADAFRKRFAVGVVNHEAFVAPEHLARTWGDHGELFELPNGWRFQDNMIQSSLGAPGDNLFAVITYDADNLPNPWEWRLHETRPSASTEPMTWDVPTTPDKPRAGWAPSLLAAMTRARTAGSLHLDDRRAAGGA